jgi:uncharacterized spore protein YtfJ
MNELLKSIIDPLESSASVKRIYGEPISANGKTVIPVARIAYGFGGGSGRGLLPGKEGSDHKEGEGGGGGGGVVAVPVGLYEVSDTGTRFVPMRDNRKLVAAGLLGVCLGLLWRRR